jgi:hypothetical protein
MSVQKVNGKAGSASYGGTTLSVTKWRAKVTRELADSTDSSNYDATTNMVHKSQIPATLQCEGTVEGFFDLNSTQAAIIAQLYSGNAAVNLVLGITSSVNFGHGLVDIGDFECDLTIGAENVKWSATFKSNGVWTMGS